MLSARKIRHSGYIEMHWKSGLSSLHASFPLFIVEVWLLECLRSKSLQISRPGEYILQRMGNHASLEASITGLACCVTSISFPSITNYMIIEAAGATSNFPKEHFYFYFFKQPNNELEVGFCMHMSCS